MDISQNQIFHYSIYDKTIFQYLFPQDYVHNLNIRGYPAHNKLPECRIHLSKQLSLFHQ